MKTIAFSALLLSGIAALAAWADEPATDLIARGEYLATIMDCAGCHMPRGADGAPQPQAGLSGGPVGFEIPGMGTFWPPNLTPSASGLGDWSDAEIAAAITTGTKPDGRTLAPAMPWPSYAVLDPADVDALIAFLRSRQPVESNRVDPIGPGEDAPAPFYRVVMPQN